MYDDDDEFDEAFMEGQRLALDSMDLPDGAYLAMADEMGLDPLGGFEMDEGP